jgi:alkanesulfonate monooxygenase
MRFALMIEAQQGMTYEDQLALVRVAEDAGFEAFFRSDHYASFPGPGDGESTDAWAVLAGLARETATITLGTLVSPVTFRHPGNFAKLVTTVDQMAGGRLEIGVGAGWNADDHAPLGLPFPSISERADLLEDQLAILHGLWTEAPGWSYQGHVIHVEGGLLHPGAVDRPDRPRGASGRPRPRLITGGQGSPRGFRIAVRWADEFNLSSASPETARRRMAELDDACRAAGREPAALTRSAMVGVLVGRDEAEVERRMDDLRRTLGAAIGDDPEWLAERRSRWMFGTPDEARAAARRFADAGIERIMLQDFLPFDHAMVELLADELIGRV